MIEPGESGLKTGQLISENDYYEVRESLKEKEAKLPEDEDGMAKKRFSARMGGEAIRELLQKVDIDTLSRELRVQIQTESSVQRKRDALKRLQVIEAFRKTESGKPNKCEWMVMSVIPVIPPELRPLVPLEGGRFATSDLNDLYRRVIIRNNRLKKLLEIRAPEVILRNEKRMLQEAVDSLFNNGKRRAAVRGEGNRPLKSLSDMLRGKQGRFRQNLLGKRIDYSGRSVIVVGPELKMDQCGLPKEMALELFKPFVIRQLVERSIVKTVKSAKKLVERRGDEVWDILEEIIQDHPVLLNRAPTLHRLGIQAFQPILVEGKAISIHPLVCAAFNADFDGDQMAVHVPLSVEAQMEAKILMLSSHNILSPANGRPLAIPSQDIVLGCYYLTKAKKGDLGEGKLFADTDEVLSAYYDDKIGLHAKIKVRVLGKRIETTTGRVLFNEIVPMELGFVNELLTKKRMEEIIAVLLQGRGKSAHRPFPRRPEGTRIHLRHEGRRHHRAGRRDHPEGKSHHGGKVVERGRTHPDALRKGRDHGRRALQQGHRRLDPDHQPGGGTPLRPSPRIHGRVQPRLHDGRFGRARQQGADPAAGRHARPHGQAPEETHRRHGRNHRIADHGEFPRRAVRFSNTSSPPTAPGKDSRTRPSRRPTPDT